MEPKNASEERAASGRSAAAELRDTDSGDTESVKPNRTNTKKANAKTTKAKRTNTKKTETDVRAARDNVPTSPVQAAMPASDNAQTGGSAATTTARFNIVTGEPEAVVPTGAAEAAVPADDNVATSAAEATTTARLETTPGAVEAATTAGDNASFTPASDKASLAPASYNETTTTKRGRAKRGLLKRGRSKASEAKTSASQIRGDVSDSTGSMLPVLFSEERSVDMVDLEPVSESVRYILARPGGAPEGNLPTRIAVVAALPGEGTTTISHVFSSVLSNDFGIETCRVDLSWGTTAKAGVYEVLIGAADVDDVLEWDGRTATLHSGGVSPSEQPRLARSEELDKLIAVLASRFQHVILDLPAILSSSDGLAMMRLADAYLLVVKHGVTTLRQVQIATEQLSDVELLGSVLNQVRTRTPRPLSRWLAG